MVALEVSVNGTVVYTLGVGDLGIITAQVMSLQVQRPNAVFREIVVYGQGNASGASGVIWPRTSLKIGDEVTICVVESESIDPGSPLPDPPPPRKEG